MVQLMSVSKARSNFSSLITQVAQTQTPVILIRESQPIAIIQPVTNTKSQHNYLYQLLSIQGDWFDEKENQKIKKEVEERIHQLYNE